MSSSYHNHTKKNRKICLGIDKFIFNISWVSDQVTSYPTNKISHHNLKTRFKVRLAIRLNIHYYLAFHSTWIYVIYLKGMASCYHCQKNWKWSISWARKLGITNIQSAQPTIYYNLQQGSHSDWKTWKNGKAFSSQGKVREFWTDWESQGKVRENHTKYWKTQGNWDKHYLIFLVIFKWTVYYLLNGSSFQ